MPFKKGNEYAFKKGHEPLGRALKGHFNSLETRLKIGAKSKNRIPNVATRELMSLSRLGNKNLLGHKHNIVLIILCFVKRFSRGIIILAKRQAYEVEDWLFII